LPRVGAASPEKQTSIGRRRKVGFFGFNSKIFCVRIRPTGPGALKRQRFDHPHPRALSETYSQKSDLDVNRNVCLPRPISDMPARYRTHRVGREVRHGLSKFLTQGATQRLLRLLMMTKQNYVAHRPDRAIDRKTKIFLPLTTVSKARTLRISRKLQISVSLTAPTPLAPIPDLGAPPTFEPQRRSSNNANRNEGRISWPSQAGLTMRSFPPTGITRKTSETRENWRSCLPAASPSSPAWTARLDPAKYAGLAEGDAPRHPAMRAAEHRTDAIRLAGYFP